MSFENYGKYQLIKKLATGGMAEIWLARQQGLEGFEKVMVVKRILPHLAENDEFINMFLDEARIAARLNHPNIVQIFDLGAEGDTYFIAMEYIHGEDVRRVWKRSEASGKPIPIPLVCRIIMDACAGLDYAHKKLDQSGRPLNIVHRDISPQNILATFEGGVKVVDFGIAKAADQATVTRSGVLKGKYSYMSPEQAAGKKIDHRTDVFALGVVLYELLTGARLFKRSSDIATLNAVAECAIAPPSQVNARLPKDLDAVVLKALAKDVNDRYQDAGKLQESLENWLLQNKLPSGSGHLAAFMQDIYAERLAREAEEGRFLVEELDASRAKSAEEDLAKNRATPVSKPSSGGGGPRPTASLRAHPNAPSGPQRAPSQQQIARQVDPEATQAEPEAAPPPRARSKSSSSLNKAARVPDARPEPKIEFHKPPTRGGMKSVPEPKGGTEVSQTVRRGGALPLLVTVGSVLVGLGIAGAIFLSNSKAEVRLESDPPGASVRFDGRLLDRCRTPCVLPQRAAGRYDAVVSRPGFRDSAVVVEVPERGQTTVSVRLDPTDRPVALDKPIVPDKPVAEVVDAGAEVEVVTPTPGVDAGRAPPPPQPKVLLTLNSDPQGATATVDGRSVGTTPAHLEAMPNSRVTVQLELAGYKDFKDTVHLGSALKVEKFFSLKKDKAPTPPGPTAGTGGGGGKTPVVVQPTPTVTPLKQVGSVRFVVKPWATVVCGNYKLGDTPFEEKQLPAGTYSCTFTNPDLGIKKQDVVVVANDLTKVLVNF